MGFQLCCGFDGGFVPEIFFVQLFCLFIPDRHRSACKAFAVKNGEDVTAVFASGYGDVYLPFAVEIEKDFYQASVPHHVVRRSDKLTAVYKGKAEASGLQLGDTKAGHIRLLLLKFKDYPLSARLL